MKDSMVHYMTFLLQLGHKPAKSPHLLNIHTIHWKIAL